RDFVEGAREDTTLVARAEAQRRIAARGHDVVGSVERPLLRARAAAKNAVPVDGDAGAGVILVAGVATGDDVDPPCGWTLGRATPPFLHDPDARDPEAIRLPDGPPEFPSSPPVSPRRRCAARGAAAR